MYTVPLKRQAPTAALWYTVEYWNQTYIPSHFLMKILLIYSVIILETYCLSISLSLNIHILAL